MISTSGVVYLLRSWQELRRSFVPSSPHIYNHGFRTQGWSHYQILSYEILFSYLLSAIYYRDATLEATMILSPRLRGRTGAPNPFACQYRGKDPCSCVLAHR